jgi:hypothetical protein
MSKRYPGGLITKTPVTPTPSAAPGIWTLEQQMQAQKAGTWPFGGPFNYIEDVFSTWLYTGTGAAQTITNNINLSGSGGLVWIKSRSAATNNNLFDTAQGATKLLHSNTTDATVTDANSLTAFGTTGFTLGTGNTSGNEVNTSSETYASWTFREQSNFFDIVTYTGNGANRTIAHNLGSVPGCIIVKKTSSTGNWRVYHRSLTSAAFTIQLNQTNAQSSQPSMWNSTAPTSTVFSVGTDIDVNETGQTYVAYLFAHNAGGFGLTNTDNVISCGSWSEGAGVEVNLGYEPQFVLSKNATSAAFNGDWQIADTMRGFSVNTSGNTQALFANLTQQEVNATGYVRITSTGFRSNNNATAGDRMIYIAIRRGPMKVPTVGTSVFSPITANAAAGTAQTTNFVIDSQWKAKRSSVDTLNTSVDDRLREVSTTTTASGNYIRTSSASPATTANATTQAFNNSGFQIPTYYASVSTIFYNFARAPGFFDVVCYTGTGSATTQNHNLGVVPELMIVKGGFTDWQVYSSAIANTEYLVLNTTAAKATGTTRWNSTTPTSSVFSIGTATEVNTSSTTYVAYLFATCPGVSKVGSYSGTGATQTIDCGFTGGARFVLIKRTDTTGDWYVWDTARGMVTGTDPSILFNTTAAEVNANSVYTTVVGFQIVSTAAGINASGGTYIFLAIA